MARLGLEDRPNLLRASATATVAAASVLVLLLALWRLHYVLLLALAALLVALLLTDLSRLVRRYLPISEGWSLTLVTTLFVLLAAAGTWFLGPRVSAEAGNLARRLPEAVQEVRGSLEDSGWARQALGNVDFSPFLAKVPSAFYSALGLVGIVMLVGVLGVFLAAEPQVYRRGVLKLVPPRRRKRWSRLLDELGDTLRAWLVGRLIAMLFVAVTTSTGLALLGVPLALTLGILAGLLDFVPNFGPLIAAVPALALALAESPVLAVYVAGLYLGIQVAEGYLATPLIQRRAVAMPPALIVLAQLGLGYLFGPLGVVFATPLTAVVLVLVRRLYVERLEQGSARRRAATAGEPSKRSVEEKHPADEREPGVRPDPKAH